MNPTPYQPQGNSNSHGFSGNSGGSHYGNQGPASGTMHSAGSSAAHGTLNQPSRLPAASAAPQTDITPKAEPTSKLAMELNKFNRLANSLRENLTRAGTFDERCQQAFDLANDLFGNAPTWVCFYRALLGGSGMLHLILTDNDELGRFLRTEQYHQIQLMLTALRSRDLPENDPNDPQRMITVRLPKSLHEAMCDEAGRLNISVNRLCISRMLQLLDPKMIPETTSKPRGRKPRSRSKAVANATAEKIASSPQAPPTSQLGSAQPGTTQPGSVHAGSSQPAAPQPSSQPMRSTAVGGFPQTDYYPGRRPNS